MWPGTCMLVCFNRKYKKAKYIFYGNIGGEDRSVSERSCAVERARGMRAKASGGRDIRAATSRKAAATAQDVPTHNTPILSPIIEISISNFFQCVL